MSGELNNIEILTKDDVLKVAKQFMNDNSVDVEDYSLKSYSEDKLGHMGSHLQLTVTIKKTNTNKPPEAYKFFVKALLQDSQTTIDFINELDIFTEELNFFQKVKPLLLENYEDEEWSPTCYLAKKGCLVMEDLRIKEFKLITNLVDETSILKSALTTLARFHACSIVAEARLTQLHKAPTFLNKLFPNNMKEKFLTETKASNDMVTKCMNLAIAITEYFGRNSKKIREVYDKLYEAVKPSKKYQNVICHGDLWANNLMFKNVESQPQCVLVDFQVLRYAPCVLDILQFIYLNTTSNYRQQHEHELIRFYSIVLERTIKNNDDTKTASAPIFEQILEAYQDLRFFGASLASFYLPFILIDQEKMNGIYGGSNGSDGVLFLDRTDLTFAYMKQNESYKNRIEEVVNELADIADY